MVRDTLQKISQLLEKHNAPSGALTVALEDKQKMWSFLVSNELWGGAGSIADQALLDVPDARSQLEKLMINLGREQLNLNQVNPRTEMWVCAFEKWQSEKLRQ